MWEQVKLWAIEQVIWAEAELKDKNGAEKKAAVIKKLDDMIVLPNCLEWVDDMVLSWLVDKVCDKLNAITKHNFGELNLSKEYENKIAGEIPDPEE